MPRTANVQSRAKRLDRVMGWVISSGGMLIIAAVLGILVFIAKEAFPLFRSAHSRTLSNFHASASANLLLDESGRAGMAVDRTEGIRTFALPSGKAMGSLQDGPQKPWKSTTPPDAKGQFLVLGREGRLALAQFSWNKPNGETDPARWSSAVVWKGDVPAGPDLQRLLDVHAAEAGGLGGNATLRIVGLDGQGLTWAETPVDATGPLAWKPIALPGGQSPTAALWSADAQQLYVGTRSGNILLYDLGTETHLAASLALGEGVTALGFALGQTSLLVGGEKGSMSAVQRLRTEKTQKLQLLHQFSSLDGPVLGFMSSLRDKRFLAWTSSRLVVDHLTTEKRFFDRPGSDITSAALSPRGNTILSTSAQGEFHAWSLDVPHPEISARTLWGKVHYESYDKPEFVWQSAGSTDDFEPKLSLVPLIFGTLKGTLYAMLFALPLAVLGALYTSQFATPRIRNTIKPVVEVMAALPSVVLGFLAGLVLAPLLERSAIHLLLFPLTTLLLALLAMPLWTRLPRRFRNEWGAGREALWFVPLLLAGLALTVLVAPAFERIFLGGDFRAWLLQNHGMTYDQRNSLVVGFAMGFAVIPIIFTISEDALTSVPRSLTSASLACGASPWQTAWRVVLPTASPGIFSAIMVGFGRAIGETMIVLMATGNTPIMDWSPFNGMRTLAANIAVETPEAAVHGTLYRLLFFTALLLFALTFILNTVAEVVRQHLRKRYESL